MLVFNPFVLSGACGRAFNLRFADLRKLSLLAARETSALSQLCGGNVPKSRIGSLSGSTVSSSKRKKNHHSGGAHCMSLD